MRYDDLLKDVSTLGIHFSEEQLNGNLKGLYGGNVIWIEKRLPTIEKCCILAEELGHYHTTSGDIRDQSKIENRQQEKRARSWAYKKLVPFSKIIDAHKKHIRNKFELAEYLGVTEAFLESTLERYIERHGKIVSHGKYTICFEPLGVLELFDENFFK